MFSGFLANHSEINKDKLKEKFNTAQAEEVTFSGGFCLYQDLWKEAGIQTDTWLTKDGTKGVVVYGKVYSDPNAQNGRPSAQNIWDVFQKKGKTCFAQLNGDFILLLWDADKNIRYVVRDPIGVLPVYYYQAEEGFYFSSDLSSLAKAVNASLDYGSVIQYLVYNYNPGENSVFQKIKKLRSGHCIAFRGNQIDLQKYWQLSFTPGSESEGEIIEVLREKLKQSVHDRVSAKGKIGTFLSGGLDSSSITSLLHQENVKSLSTFSFRCKGESFDESPFAQKVSDTFNTAHHVVEYTPDSVQLIQDMVELMDEPFCDVGINVATYLLTQTAKGKVNTLFTGDGGDELFAGHPVYLADMSAVYFKYIPGFIKSLAFSFGRRLKDSDKKKDLRVKAKRFSESYTYPADLGTHRWRAYYLPNALRDLFTSEIAEKFVSNDIFDEMIQYNEEGNQYDALAQSLYSDYQTVVQFYLRRMDFARKQGLWPQFPMLDKDVVEFCAKIPSKLKIPSMSETKYIEKKTIEPWLPHEIVYRKDKLGHSIPLKNWMRYHDGVQKFMIEILKDGRLEKAGLFDMQIVDTMIQEHLDKKVNHSHRLWALMVLTLWMEKQIKN